MTAPEPAPIAETVSRCIGIVVTPMGGGIRQVGGCWRNVTEMIDGQPHCRQHADEARWRAKEFQRMLDTATRHSPGIRWAGRGTECFCGEFVPDGTDHPWGVPEKLEQALRIDGSLRDDS